MSKSTASNDKFTSYRIKKKTNAYQIFVLKKVYTTFALLFIIRTFPYNDI